MAIDGIKESSVCLEQYFSISAIDWILIYATYYSLLIYNLKCYSFNELPAYLQANSGTQ